ncbi:gluconokinase [Variovorax sp. KBW07]|uniref:gluconokinase n=1 Tax=Variovorax sp. KBW07 TaxID=2153358 RepID=UPI000F57A0B1|nr:gluconokinase [Variovorax sp. KBW07]RQO46209.1 gluconokinase [Variovorax sp. KBW07]
MSPPEQEQQPRQRLAVVVMGVSGTGKSSVAAALAGTLRLPWVDGDHLHVPAAVARMQAGLPLSDDDRWPWLDRIGACLADGTAAPGGVVVACSALKRAYRDRLRAAAPGLRFVFLDGPAQLIRQRLEQRRGHYMPPALLDSQLHTLERPGDDEPDVLHAGIDAPVALAVAHIGARLLQSKKADSTKAPA